MIKPLRRQSSVRPKVVKALVLAAFIGCVWGANWMISHVGQVHPSGARTIPVGFGWHAPSGVVLVGASLTLRDVLQRWTNPLIVVAAIAVGAALSAVLSRDLALASGVTFLLAELADLAIYTPMRERNLAAAILASNAVGAIVDSALFLALAFGWPAALELALPLTLGKVEWSLVALPALLLGRTRMRRRTRAWAT